MSDISDLKRQKFALKRAALEARHKMVDELQESTDRVGHLVRNTAIIAGSLFAGYIVFRIIAGPEKASKKEQVAVQKAGAGAVRRTVRNRLKQRIIQEASLYLLGIARDQLIHYLTRKSQKNDDDIQQAARD
jgi:hypothetical protein